MNRSTPLDDTENAVFVETNLELDSLSVTRTEASINICGDLLRFYVMHCTVNFMILCARSSRFRLFHFCCNLHAMDTPPRRGLHVLHLRGIDLLVLLEQSVRDRPHKRRAQPTRRHSECQRAAIDGTGWSRCEPSPAFPAAVGDGYDFLVHPPGTEAQLDAEGDSNQLPDAAIPRNTANPTTNHATRPDLCRRVAASFGQNRHLERVGGHFQDAYQRLSSCGQLR